MFGYAVRRILQAIPVVFFAISLLFMLFYVLPGDPVDTLSGAQGREIPQVQRDNIEKKLGLDKPVIEQFTSYWGDVLHGDLGDSYKTGRPVIDTVKRYAPNSIRLAIWALLLEIVIGIGVGIISAVKRYSFLDTLTTLTTTVAMAIPVFVTGYALIYFFGIKAYQSDWPAWLQFRTGGTPQNWKFLIFPGDDESFRRLVLPAIALAFVQIAVVARMTRATMLETINTDYLRTARAKGLSEPVVTFKHGLRNAMIPVVTLIGLDFGTMIGSAVLTEFVFSYNGLGSAIVSAATTRDAPLVLGLSLVVVIVYLAVNLLVDLSYGVLDPRVRYDDN